MKSSVNNRRCISIAGRKTSLSLEDAFWNSIRDIAEGRGESLSQLIASIDEARQFGNLSSAVRLFVLRYYRDQFDQQSGTIVVPESILPLTR